MKVDVIVGMQWGDEGKGKMIDVLSEDYDIIARYQGGPNAGHTIVFNGKEIVLHSLPSGFCRSHCINVMGNGVVINPTILKKEVSVLSDDLGMSMEEIRSRLIISSRATFILPSHVLLDAYDEKDKGNQKIGSTLRGVGPCYADKVGRKAISVGQLFANDFKERIAERTAVHEALMKIDKNSVDLDEWLDAAEWMKQFKINQVELYLHRALKAGKRVLAEGAQGAMLDINFGTYPYVTSSSTTAASVCQGLGVTPHQIGKVYGVCKAYTTRVGGGLFPTELCDKMGKLLQDKGNEYGSTTGRPRRCGWLDIPLLNYAIMLNGVTHLMLMKVDVLSGVHPVKVASHYMYEGREVELISSDEIMLKRAHPVYKEMDSFTHIHQVPYDAYISYVEERTGVPIAYVSFGPDREQVQSRG